jgi:ubiquinone/menaquinone biosynthesis C-methylase UbiE
VPTPVLLVRGSAEQLPFANAVFDIIVTTWTLCSIPNPVAALIEMRGVLKLGGNLVLWRAGEPRAKDASRCAANTGSLTAWR